MRRKQLAIVASAVVAIVGVIVVTAPGTRVPPRPGSAEAGATDRAIDALLAGIPQSGNALGHPSAPVTMRWYGDLECPFCREFTLGALPSIISRWVRGGQLQIEYLSMQTATHDSRVFQTQQVAALSAGLQDKLWNFIETFYHEQGEEDSGYVTGRYLDGLASQLPGLNLVLWMDDRHDPELDATVMAERAAAARAHFRATPTFVVGRRGGTMYRFRAHSLTDPRSFDEAIEYFLRR